VVKKAQIIGAKEVDQIISGSQPNHTSTCTENQQVGDYFLHLKSYHFYYFSTRIGTCMFDICVLDDIGVLE